MFNYVNLDVHPAFGYETSTTRNVAFWQNDEKAEKLAQIEWEKVRDQPGATEYSLPGLIYRDISLYGESRSFANNISKILSYLPIISVIVGIARVSICANSYRRYRAYLKDSKWPAHDPRRYAQLQAMQVFLKHIARGVTEIALGVFSLGHILIIPDMIQTALYAKAAKLV